jgi:hypothetical protein
MAIVPRPSVLTVSLPRSSLLIPHVMRSPFASSIMSVFVCAAWVSVEAVSSSMTARTAVRGRTVLPAAITIPRAARLLSDDVAEMA